MAKLYSLSEIILDADTVVPRHTVFDATPSQAKQFDALKAARPATADEVAAAKEAEAIKDGSAFLENMETAARPAADAEPVKGRVDISMPDSGAEHDPNSKPSSKSK